MHSRFNLIIGLFFFVSLLPASVPTMNSIDDNAELTPNALEKIKYIEKDYLQKTEEIKSDKYKELSIEADFVHYLEENDYIEATGNVILIYKDYLVSANRTLLDTDDENITISEGFLFNRDLSRMTGDDLFYDFKKEEGYATAVSLNLHNVFIRGKNVSIYRDKIVIDEPYQSSCPYATISGRPCNHVTAKRITVYPQWWDIVADHAIIYGFGVPLMYVPNYVYSSAGDISDVIPQFGYNRVEGNYAKVGIGYYKNEKLNGTYDIAYLSELGWRTGFRNNYKLDQSQRGQLRAHYLTGLGGRTSYGWQHRILLGVPYRDKTQMIDEFFKGILPPSNQQYPEFVIDVTDRELVNYQWLSYQPKLTLISPYYSIYDTGAGFKSLFFTAYIKEEGERYGNKNFNKNYWDVVLDRPLDFGQYGRFIPSTTYMKTGYMNGPYQAGAWKRFYYNLDYLKSWQVFSLRTGYKNTFEENGTSPFEFDKFNLSTKEEVNYTLFFSMSDKIKLSYQEDYSLTDDRLRNRNYGVDFKICCWTVGLTWYEKEERFAFNISLN